MFYVVSLLIFYGVGPVGHPGRIHNMTLTINRRAIFRDMPRLILASFFIIILANQAVAENAPVTKLPPEMIKMGFKLEMVELKDSNGNVRKDGNGFPIMDYELHLPTKDKTEIISSCFFNKAGEFVKAAHFVSIKKTDAKTTQFRVEDSLGNVQWITIPMFGNKLEVTELLAVDDKGEKLDPKASFPDRFEAVRQADGSIKLEEKPLVPQVFTLDSSKFKSERRMAPEPGQQGDTGASGAEGVSGSHNAQ